MGTTNAATLQSSMMSTLAVVTTPFTLMMSTLQLNQWNWLKLATPFKVERSCSPTSADGPWCRQVAKGQNLIVDFSFSNDGDSAAGGYTICRTVGSNRGMYWSKDTKLRQPIQEWGSTKDHVSDILLKFGGPKRKKKTAQVGLAD